MNPWARISRKTMQCTYLDYILCGRRECVCVYMVSVLITTISCPGTPHCLYTNRSLGDGVWLSFRPRLCIFLGTTPSTSSITEGSFLSQLALFCTEVAAVVMFASGVIRSSLLLLFVVPYFFLSLCLSLPMGLGI